MSKRKADDLADSKAVKKPALDARSDFYPALFDDAVLEKHRASYAASTPYKHAVIDKLIDESLLKAVRDEIRAHISFTRKETDIYRILQSGDLQNLDGLDDASIKLLPSLVRLRNAMYSPEFREYLSKITGAGKLSGKKTDMAVNVYTPGCHLLTHDDVIGSRRVSYILYLTDPEKPWRKEWGGALRLFDTDEVKVSKTPNGNNKASSRANGKSSNGTSQETIRIPRAHPNVSIPPAFNQLSFFAVQPGLSYHDVEEVYASADPSTSAPTDGGRIRMAISGWFHIPQEGEDGYILGAEEEQATQSSLAQLQGKNDTFDRPQPQWTVYPESIKAEGSEMNEDTELSEDDLSFLIKFMNPQYLTPDAVEELQEKFMEESSLQLGLFLSKSFSETLKEEIERTDGKAKNDDSDARGNWKIAVPPHKHRFLYQQLMPSDKQRAEQGGSLHALLNEFLPSQSFKKWLALATGLDLNESNILARRFRRGMDYTLATNYTRDQPQLELCLGLTPTDGWEEGVEDDEERDEAATDAAHANGGTSSNGDGQKKSDTSNVPEGGVGGYEMYMAGEDDDDDDHGDEDNENEKKNSNEHNHGVNIPSSSTGAGNRRGGKADPAIYKAAGADEDDGVLFVMPASWNTVSIVLRDQGTMKFTKYVSQSAKGDRWDICGEWKCEFGEEEDEEDEEEDGDEDGN